MYIRVTLYWGNLIVLWLVHLGMSCNVVVFICFVMCGCVYVCVGFVMCVCFGNMCTSILRLPWLEVCKANARVKHSKTGHGPHSSKLVVICVVLLLIVLLCVLFVCKCVLYCCHRLSTQPQVTNISYHIILYRIVSYHIYCSVSCRIISYIMYNII
jgi:hypothetical protein